MDFGARSGYSENLRMFCCMEFDKKGEVANLIGKEDSLPYSFATIVIDCCCISMGNISEVSKELE